MIVKEYEVEKMVCDECDVTERLLDGDFMGEVQAAKGEGWKITRPEGQWHHICPECAQSQSALAQARRRFGLRT